MNIWVKVTMDKYEHIVAMGDTAQELADKLGVSVNTILSNISKSKKFGHNCCYKKIVIEDDKESELQDENNCGK